MRIDLESKLAALPGGPPRLMGSYDPPREPFLHVVHQDEAVLVLDKPAGLLAVPGKPEGHEDCLEARARARFRTARPAHRLDMATSGLCVMGLTQAAHAHLSGQFERRETAKTYAALVWGGPDAEAGEIDLPLICDWPNRPLQHVDPVRGKPSLTRWRVRGRERLASGALAARLELTPVTGRSHQLRVHLAAAGWPILGDEFYAHETARAASPRLALHAERLGFRHPVSGEPVAFVSPAPF